MSKGYAISGIRSLLSAMLGWCKRAAARHWQGKNAIVRSATDGHRNDQFETARLTDASRPLEEDFNGKLIELGKFIKLLKVGDRIRVLCDDGVVVAEKVSDTKFKLIHSQMMSKFVH